MRIGTALLTAACFMSGIVVFGAAAQAQTYAPGYQSGGYHTGYQGVYQGGYVGSGYEPVGVIGPIGARSGMDHAGQSYASPAYSTPVYDAPRDDPPAYQAPVEQAVVYQETYRPAPSYTAGYVEPRPAYRPAPTCHERGW